MEVNEISFYKIRLSGGEYSWIDVNLIADLYPRNVVTQLPNINSLTIEQLYSSFSKPELEPITRCDKKPLGPEVPPYAVLPAYFWSVGIENLIKRIQIIDFGEAFLFQENRKELYIPLSYRAPESYFNEVVGTPADIWAFGCTVFDLFGHGNIFETYMPTPQSILSEIISILGPLPSVWRQKERIPSDSPFFHLIKDTTSDSNPNNSETLASCIREMRSSTFDSQETSQSVLSDSFVSEAASNLENLLTGCLKYIPAERSTAQEIVESRWIQEIIKFEI